MRAQRCRAWKAAVPRVTPRDFSFNRTAKEKPMMWVAMRHAAMARHIWLWNACGRNPYTLPLHVGMVRAFYGF